MNGRLQRRVWVLTDDELRELHAALEERREAGAYTEATTVPHAITTRRIAANHDVIDRLVEEIEAEQERRSS